MPVHPVPGRRSHSRWSSRGAGSTGERVRSGPGGGRAVGGEQRSRPASRLPGAGRVREHTAHWTRGAGRSWPRENCSRPREHPQSTCSRVRENWGSLLPRTGALLRLRSARERPGPGVLPYRGVEVVLPVSLQGRSGVPPGSPRGRSPDALPVPGAAEACRRDTHGIHLYPLTRVRTRVSGVSGLLRCSDGRSWCLIG